MTYRVRGKAPSFSYGGLYGALAIYGSVLYNVSVNKFKSHKNVFFSCKYHVIFCPKYRGKVLVDGVDRRLKEWVAEVASTFRVDNLELEVRPDPMHIVGEVNVQFGNHRFVK